MWGRIVTGPSNLAFVQLVPGYFNCNPRKPTLDFHPFCGPAFIAPHYQTPKTAGNGAYRKSNQVSRSIRSWSLGSIWFSIPKIFIVFPELLWDLHCDFRTRQLIFQFMEVTGEISKGQSFSFQPLIATSVCFLRFWEETFSFSYLADLYKSLQFL